MRKRFRIGMMALVVIAVCGGIWFSLPPKEPVYQGKPLRYWLTGYDLPPSLWYTLSLKRPVPSKSKAALREIGTNAIPTLLQMLRERDSPLEKKFIELARWQPVYKVNWQYREAAMDGYDAVVAFRNFERIPVGLVPELVKIYDLNPNPFARQFVVTIASFIGRESEQTGPFLLHALRETNDYLVRLDAAVSLYTVHPPPNRRFPR